MSGRRCGSKREGPGTSCVPGLLVIIPPLERGFPRGRTGDRGP